MLDKLNILKWQLEYFYDSKHRFKLLHKGRRLGATYGACFYSVLTLENDDYNVRENQNILWGDTVLGNIDRYYHRYFRPLLLDLGISHNYSKQQKLLEFNGTQIDFRGADRPENWEGFGYDLILLNEAGIILKKPSIWENTVSPMLLDNPNSEVLIYGTPKGKNYFYELSLNKMFKVFNYSTYENPMLKFEDIELIKQTIPTHVQEQEIYGKFIDVGNLFMPDWYKEYADISKFDRLVFGVDLAISSKETADYTAVSVVGIIDNKYYIVDVRRTQTTTGHKEFISQLANEYGPDGIYIESNQFQQLIANDLITNTNLPIIKKIVTKDKYTRALPMAAKMEMGLVYINKNIDSNFTKELYSFPDGKNDDMVDAVTIAFNNLNIGNLNIYTL